MLVLLLIAFQSVSQAFKVPTLAGADPAYPEAKFEAEAWFSGKLQQALNQQTTATYGFRELLVRAYNQAVYSAFGAMNPAVAKGKNGFLFERGYEGTVCGKGLLSEAEIQTKVDSLLVLDAWLQSRGQKLYLMMAPNKWRYHQDLAPWSCEVAEETNYKRLQEALSKTDLAFIDVIALFESWKSTTEHPLHAQSGTHWSNYGAWRVIDHLNERLEADGFDMPNIEVTDIQVADEPHNTDKDLQELLNVFQKAQRFDLAYPHFAFPEEPSTRALIITDSYYWNFFHLELHDKLWASESPFLYYNNFRYRDFWTKEVIEEGDRERWMKECDVVFMTLHEPTIKKLGYGFLKDAFNIIHSSSETMP